MSSAPAGRKPGRGGRGRGRGGRGSRGRGRGTNKKSEKNSSTVNNESNSGGYAKDSSEIQTPMAALRDEDILIAFMPYMRGDNQEATAIHEAYQTSNDQVTFLQDARRFLAREEQKRLGTTPNTTRAPTQVSTSRPEAKSPIAASFALQPDQTTHRLAAERTHEPVSIPSTLNQRQENGASIAELERKMLTNLLSDEHDPVVAMPTAHSSRAPAIGGSNNGQNQVPISTSPHHSQLPNTSIIQQQHQGNHAFNFDQLFAANHAITNPAPSSLAPTGQSTGMIPASLSSNSQPINPGKKTDTQSVSQLPPGVSWGGVHTSPQKNQTPHRATAAPTAPSQEESTSLGNTNFVDQVRAKIEIPKPAPKKEFQPKRLLTRFEDQPGRLLANNVQPSIGAVLDLRPRQELEAKWMLPLAYLRKRSTGKDVKTIRESLVDLTVGLFRRGCTENGTQASIISKEILAPPGENRKDYPLQIVNDTVIGTVPFYSPRTPGHVVFRLYWQSDPLETLATGPTLNVRVTEDDFESSIRFILSNFKTKKVNPTSLSSLNSFSLVLDQFELPQTSLQHPHNVQQQLEGAGRAVWGCICESRKVLDACSSEYTKTTSKLQKLEVGVEELKKIVEVEGDDTRNDGTDEGDESENAAELKEKLKTLMSGKASCERKWRDSQLAFASILRAVVKNPSITLLLRRELIIKMRLEFELWCPLCEEFAVIGEQSEGKMWYEPLNDLPHSITEDHFRLCRDARSKMQVRILGFAPQVSNLESILFAKQGTALQMQTSAVSTFNQLSAAMGKLYQEVYSTAESIVRQREVIRNQMELFVSSCSCFPHGTKVAIFGSSANGFDSPESDLDMCLQVPPGFAVTSEEDVTGAIAMAKLAQALQDGGMQDVDISRLTARIPVIKFNCPATLLRRNSAGEVALMECDLSMHNPLAVLNTSLLRTYAEITPVTRVLASIVKRWAKARDINNPARHTLSSYGYLIMLLHFLTYHKRTGNGLVSPFSSSDRQSIHNRSVSTPLLPNLQWVDEMWAQGPPGTPYRELKDPPKEMMKHPQEEKTVVNTHFYRPSNAAEMGNLQRLFPGQDLSLAILLASFFRYYAYDFDYKKHVVSLHSTISHGLVEREVKAELDGWRNYSAALTIEDPFETFYDVAHVLRGGYYHRIRREFALAFTKIACIAEGKTDISWSSKSIDPTSMTGMDLLDWICEVASTDSEASASEK